MSYIDGNNFIKPLFLFLKQAAVQCPKAGRLYSGYHCIYFILYQFSPLELCPPHDESHINLHVSTSCDELDLCVTGMPCRTD